MADQRIQSTSTKETLSSSPADMPNRGGSKPNLQSTSSTVSLSRTENPVAAFGASPGQGEVQCESTNVKLSRTANSPYDNKKLSATTPQIDLKGGGRGKR